MEEKPHKRISVPYIKVIYASQSIIEKYSIAGKLTLLQLHDILIDSGEIQEDKRSYKRLQEIISKAKDLGMIEKYALAGRGNGLTIEQLERLKNG